jgi:Beta-galactosidase
MMLRQTIYSVLLCIGTGALLNAQTGAAYSAPHLEKRGDIQQLIVDGKPFLVLGGEVYNNSSSSLEYMNGVWPALQAEHLNTVVAPVSWGLMEPAEGKFNFSLVDGLVRDARAHNMHLVLLWFGSWKNTWSSYMPDWVKRDYQRFPRVHLADGTATERLSPFNDANRDADARAFAALMHRLKEIDGNSGTVLMVQVENEVGVIPDARDYSADANAAYAQPVPNELMNYLRIHKDALHPELRARWEAAGGKTSGNWEAIFGAGQATEDLFMAWYYARYINSVVEAGKAQFDLPMFVNAALIRPSYAPGQFNSGGPLSHSIDIWRAGGPKIDFLAPDIYFEFKKWCAEYDRPGNPLFVPESATGGQGAAQAFYAIGNHNSIGYSPFGIDPDGPVRGKDSELTRAYDTLSQLAPLILENQPKHQVAAVMIEELTRAQRIRIGNYTLNITPNLGRRPVPVEVQNTVDAPVRTPHAIFIAVKPDELYMAGSGVTITFDPIAPGFRAGLGTVEEGEFVNGEWHKGRTLGGDDTGQGNSISLRDAGPPILRVSLYLYK